MLVRADRLFAPTHLAPPFNPALESVRPRNLPVCRLGVNSLVGAARAFWTSGRGGAGAVRVSGGLWRSCTSGVECTAQLAVGTLRLPRAVRQKGPCEARGVTHAGLREPASGFCDALGARCAAPAALLRCESQFPSDACAACTKANERAARGSQGMARALGCGQVGGGGRLAATPGTHPVARGVLAAGGGRRRTLCLV